VTRKNAIFHFSIFFPILISNLFFPRHPTVPFSPACHPTYARTMFSFFPPWTVEAVEGDQARSAAPAAYPRYVLRGLCKTPALSSARGKILS
jgi:hypothetical protein